MDRVKRIAWMAASVWLVLSAGPSWAQPDGPALMQAGNEAFRAGLFEDARDRYRNAVAKGFDTALLQYNLGVAHYRLGEFAEAEIALAKAAADPGLEPLATYNLGLASLAGGWAEAAARRFERVLQISTDAALSELAVRALERTRSPDIAEVDADRERGGRRPWREPAPPIGELYLVIAARYGTDDNVYRTPSAAYVDLAQSGQPTIDPKQQSAAFMPVDLLAHYTVTAEQQNTDFIFAYRMNGDFYDSAYSNANEVTQRFEVGADVGLQGKHARVLETAFFGVIHDETNFDPDTGVDRDVAGQDISDRFSYRGAGLESGYEHLMDRWAFGFDTRIERRSYEDAPTVTRYDHAFYHVDFWTERRLAGPTDVFFGLHGYRREYDARRARDSTGVLSTANPTLEYTYAAAELGARRRFGEGIDLELALRRTEREDNFEGYANYSQNTLRIGLQYRPNRRMRIGLWADTQTYDYPDAFAFNDPAGGALDIDSTDVEIDFEYRFNPRIAIWTELLRRDDSSTDPRLSYARNRAIVGIKWRY